MRGGARCTLRTSRPRGPPLRERELLRPHRARSRTSSQAARTRVHVPCRSLLRRAAVKGRRIRRRHREPSLSATKARRERGGLREESGQLGGTAPCALFGSPRSSSWAHIALVGSAHRRRARARNGRARSRPARENGGSPFPHSYSSCHR